VNAADMAALVGALMVMLVGLVGAVLPGLPGTPLILAAAIGHRLIRGDAGVSWWVVGVMAFITAASVGLDFLASSVGAQRMGATWRGMVGAAIGALLGLLWIPVGLVAGPLVGAMALEMLGGREWRAAGRAGVGAVLGLVAGAIGKVACGLGMIGLFVVHMLVRWMA